MCVRGVPSNKIFRSQLWKKITFCAFIIFYTLGQSTSCWQFRWWDHSFIFTFIKNREYKQSDQYFELVAVQFWFPSRWQCHFIMHPKKLDKGCSIFHLDVALFCVVCASSMYYVLIHHVLSIEIELPRSETTCISIDRHEAWVYCEQIPIYYLIMLSCYLYTFIVRRYGILNGEYRTIY